MNKKNPVAGHVADKASLTIHKICRTFFATTHTQYFCYIRRYKDGRITFLPSNFEFSSYFFEDDIYPYTWFSGIPFSELKSGYTFWDIARRVNDEGFKNIGGDLTESFKLAYGIEVLDKHENHCDFYSFSGNDISLYFISLPYLYQFIYYFRQECHSLLLTAYEDTISLCPNDIVLAPIPIILGINPNPATQENDSFSIKRYHLDGKYQGVFLTKREVEILRKMASGDAVKCLADSLNISARTLEHHIANIKHKLGASRASELLHIARTSNIIY